MPFVLSDPQENEIKLAELLKTEEGARAAKEFEIECEFRRKLGEARRNSAMKQSDVAKKSGLQQ